LREIRATEYAEDNGAVLDECECDGVLIESEESLGAVDGVEGPVFAGGTAFVGSPVDGGEDGFLIEIALDLFDVVDHFGTEFHVFNFTKFGGIFLAHERNIGEGVGEGFGDDGLGPEIGDGNGRFVFLIHRFIGDEIRLNGGAEFAGLEDGGDGDLSFGGQGCGSDGRHGMALNLSLVEVRILLVIGIGGGADGLPVSDQYSDQYIDHRLIVINGEVERALFPMVNCMTTLNREQRSLIINTGDLASLAAVATRDRPERCVLWHPVFANESAPRSRHSVAEQAAIYGIDDFVEFRLAEMLSELHRAEDGKPGIGEWPMDTTGTQTMPPIGLWSFILMLSGESASAYGCRNILWPIHLGSRPFESHARVTELHGLIGHLFDLSEDLRGISIEMPFVDFDDRRMVDLAARSDAPLRACWWCVHASPEACGGCDGCRRWDSAFKAAGIENPWKAKAFT